MKTKLSLSFLLILALSPVPCALSQIPQGFNYQAVARLTTGEPIINTTLPVRITIQTDSLGTSIIWQELHNSVTTNGFGLITLVLGKGARQAASTVATFSAIDWTMSPKFIKTEINYSGWKTMGVTRLWSVPYSSIAEGLGGPVKKLAVKGVTALPDEPLFEVKNKDGQTVFAVYNEGVRVYVSDGAKALKGGFAVGGFGTDKAESTKYLFVGKDSVRIYLDTNPLTKKLKGGFAVGGYDVTKGLVQDYLDVNSDSVRIYIDSNPETKKLKGGFAVGGYDMTKGTNTNYMNVNTDASGIINPSQNRILWYPLKNAFLTGRVLVENKDSVGENSFASGYESKAKGMYSQALGYKAIARGDYSTAIGKNAVANKINSFAFGEDARATNAEGYAIGRGAIASGYRSFAFGSAGVDSAGAVTGVAYAKGDYSFAIGQGSQSSGNGAFTLGLADTAKGIFSTAIGYEASALNDGSIAMGYKATASGHYSMSIGLLTHASGDNSTALGRETTASRIASTAMGWGTTASGNSSTAMGEGTIASGAYSIAIGCFTKSIGLSSLATGYYTVASGNYSNALGSRTTASGHSSNATGSFTTALGRFSTAMGYYTKANTYGMVTVGKYNDTTKYNGDASYNSWYANDPLFVIGNGTADNSRSNAITVLKDGRVGLQTVIRPSYALELPNNSITQIGRARAYAWETYSDGRIKSEQTTLSYGLDEIMKLKPSEYFHHSTLSDNDGIKLQNEGKHDIGLIAQEVYDIIPEVVNKPENEDKELWSISYDKLIPVVVNAIKEQQQQIESYKSENNNLRSQLQSLQKKVDKIEGLLAKALDE